MNSLLLTSCLEGEGFFLLRRAFAAMECDQLQAEWDAACASGSAGLIRSASGSVYGARNSGHSRAPDRHRRILHLEFSGVRDVPDGYALQTFIAARRTPQATNIAAAAPRSRD